MENKPKFKYGDIVKVDMSILTLSNEILDGKIVGKSTEHVIDYWLVEFDDFKFECYPYKVLSIPHIAIVNENISEAV